MDTNMPATTKLDIQNVSMEVNHADCGPNNSTDLAIRCFWSVPEGYISKRYFVVYRNTQFRNGSPVWEKWFELDNVDTENRYWAEVRKAMKRWQNEYGTEN